MATAESLQRTVTIQGKRYYDVGVNKLFPSVTTISGKMTDKSGKIISENKYLLLVGDEKVDLPRLREIGQEARDKKAKYGSHNYLRYFEGLNGTRGVKQADEKMPVVKEFDK